MKRQFRNYKEKLLQDLQDPEAAIAYLNAALIDEDPHVFLLALKNVHEAQGGRNDESCKENKSESRKSVSHSF